MIGDLAVKSLSVAFETKSDCVVRYEWVWLITNRYWEFEFKTCLGWFLIEFRIIKSFFMKNGRLKQKQNVLWKEKENRDILYMATIVNLFPIYFLSQDDQKWRSKVWCNNMWWLCTEARWIFTVTTLFLVGVGWCTSKDTTTL